LSEFKNREMQMQRRNLLQWVIGALAVVGLAKVGGARERADVREIVRDERTIYAFRPSRVARIELVGADGNIKASRRLGFPVRMEYGDKLVVTLGD